jgi:hypothetical protein
MADEFDPRDKMDLDGEEGCEHLDRNIEIVDGKPAVVCCDCEKVFLDSEACPHANVEHYRQFGCDMWQCMDCDEHTSSYEWDVNEDHKTQWKVPMWLGMLN